MEIIMLLLFLFVLIGNVSFLTYMLNFSPSTAPVTIFLGFTLFLYFFSLLDILIIGLYIAFGIAILLAFLGFYYLLKHKDVWRKVVNLPFIIFVITVIACWLYTRYTMFHLWDEFSHWGVIFKYLMLMDRLPTDPGIVIASYPPFSPLFQYFISKILGFKEANAYFAQMIIIYSALIAAIPEPRQKSKVLFVLAFIISGISLHAFDYYAQTLYADAFMGVLFGCGLSLTFLYREAPHSKFTSILFIIMALVLIKPTGKLFALLLMLIFIISVTSLRGKIQFRDLLQIPKNDLVKVLFILIFPLLTVLSWTFLSPDLSTGSTQIVMQGPSLLINEMFPLYPSDYRLELQELDSEVRFKEKLLMEEQSKIISIEEIIKSFTIVSPYRTKLIFNRMTNDFTDNATFYRITKITVIQYLTFFSLLMIFLAAYNRQEDASLVTKTYISYSVIFITLFIYIIFLYLAYVFIFYPDEAIFAPSFPRYLGTYLLGWWLLLFTRLLRIVFTAEKQNWVKGSQVILFSIVLIMVNIIPFYRYVHIPMSPDPERFVVLRVYKMINQVGLDETNKVYHIWQTEAEDGYSHYVMRYYLMPVPSNMHGWKLGPKYSETDIFTANLTPEEWLSLLNDQGYTHVLVSIADANFYNTYRKLFDTFDYTENQKTYEAIPQLFLVKPDGLYRIPLDE